MVLQMAGPPGIEQVVAFCAAVDAGAPPAPGALPPPPGPGALPPPPGALLPAPPPGARSCRRAGGQRGLAGAARGAACRPVELFAGSGGRSCFTSRNGDGQRRLHGYTLIEKRAP